MRFGICDKIDGASGLQWDDWEKTGEYLAVTDRAPGEIVVHSWVVGRPAQSSRQKSMGDEREWNKQQGGSVSVKEWF